MITPSKAADAQSDCILFKLAAETRNQIYDLVYATETNDDGAVELNGTTRSPCKDLILTCQQIYNESRKMYEAAYRDYPTKFTINIANRESPLPFTTTLDNELLRRMEYLSVTWRADEHNKGQPLRFTSTFNLGKGVRNWCEVELNTNDTYCRGREAADKVCFKYRNRSSAAMGGFYYSYLCSSRLRRYKEDVKNGLAQSISFAVGQPCIDPVDG
jgi:hypothetical protein